MIHSRPPPPRTYTFTGRVLARSVHFTTVTTRRYDEVQFLVIWFYNRTQGQYIYTDGILNMFTVISWPKRGLRVKRFVDFRKSTYFFFIYPIIHFCTYDFVTNFNHYSMIRSESKCSKSIYRGMYLIEIKKFSPEQFKKISRWNLFTPSPRRNILISVNITACRCNNYRKS